MKVLQDYQTKALIDKALLQTDQAGDYLSGFRLTIGKFKMCEKSSVCFVRMFFPTPRKVKILFIVSHYKLILLVRPQGVQKDADRKCKTICQL